MTTVRHLIGIAATAILAACSAPPWAVRVPAADSPAAHGETVALLKQARLRPVSLGDVTPVVVASETLGEATASEPPLVAGAEAAHLRETLLAQLQAASLVDAASPWVLTSTVLHADLGRDSGALAARFRLAGPDGVIAYERELRSSATWAPALGSVGARWIAKEHGALYQKLAMQLFSDPGFQRALKR